jgi:hypothetical protein
MSTRAPRDKHSAPAVGRALMREQCVRFLGQLIASGLPREKALTRASDEFRFRASARSLRRWESAYKRHGFSGLFEHKVGRVGRKSA